MYHNANSFKKFKCGYASLRHLERQHFLGVKVSMGLVLTTPALSASILFVFFDNHTLFLIHMLFGFGGFDMKEVPGIA